MEKAKAFQAADEKKLLAARNGTANRAWVEKSLEAKGYEIIDDVYSDVMPDRFVGYMMRTRFEKCSFHVPSR